MKHRRYQRYENAAIILQAHFRGYKSRKFVEHKKLQIKYENHLKATVILQKYIRGYLTRKRLGDQKIAALTIQKVWKGFQKRQEFLTFRKNVIKIQAQIKMLLARKRYLEILDQRENASVILQKYARKLLALRLTKKLRQIRARFRATSRFIEIFTEN